MAVSGSIFENPTSRVPTSDTQIVRVDMDEMGSGGRKSHLPKTGLANDMSVTHVAGNGMGSGGRRGG